MSRRAAAAALALAAVWLPFTIVPARAHVVVQRPGLRHLLQTSAAAVVVEVVSPLRMWEAPDGADRQEFFTVRALETIAGTPPPARFDVFPHGEGMPAWKQGDTALLFVERTASRPEFASLAARFPYFTVQESGQEWRLGGADGAAVLTAARSYHALSGKSATEAAPALRRLLLQGLRSGAPPLREDAMAELVRAQSVPGFFATFFPLPADLAPFTALIERKAGLPLTTRVALARILGGVHGFDAPGAVRTMTEEPLPAEEKLQLVRIAGAAPDAGISAWLAGLLASPEPLLRREAAYALGHPWHAQQAGALARTLQDPDPGVARAAIRALGSIETPEATAMLQRVANSGEGFQKQLAEAELRRIALDARPPGTSREGSDTRAPGRPLP